MLQMRACRPLLHFVMIRAYQRRVPVHPAVHARAVHVRRAEHQRRRGVALDARMLARGESRDGHQRQEQRLQEAEGHERLAPAVSQLDSQLLLPPRVELRAEALWRAAKAAQAARQLP